METATATPAFGGGPGGPTGGGGGDDDDGGGGFPSANDIAKWLRAAIERENYESQLSDWQVEKRDTRRVIREFTCPPEHRDTVPPPVAPAAPPVAPEAPAAAEAPPAESEAAGHAGEPFPPPPPVADDEWEWTGRRVSVPPISYTSEMQTRYSIDGLILPIQ